MFTTLGLKSASRLSSVSSSRLGKLCSRMLAKNSAAVRVRGLEPMMTIFSWWTVIAIGCRGRGRILCRGVAIRNSSSTVPVMRAALSSLVRREERGEADGVADLQQALSIARYGLNLLAARAEFFFHLHHVGRPPGLGLCHVVHDLVRQVQVGGGGVLRNFQVSKYSSSDLTHSLLASLN